MPKPNATHIKFKEEPPKKIAAITFGGWANANTIENYKKKKLKKALDAEGTPYNNAFYFFGYNAPFEIIKRRNEVVVELK